MRKMLLLVGMLCGALFLTGCGNDVDENKTPAQIQEEVAKMNASDIQAMVEKYQKAIDAKSAELKAEGEKLAKIPLTEQLGDNAKSIKDKMANITESLKKLQANMAAYAEGLKKK